MVSQITGPNVMQGFIGHNYKVVKSQLAANLKSVQLMEHISLGHTEACPSLSAPLHSGPVEASEGSSRAAPLK